MSVLQDHDFEVAAAPLLTEQLILEDEDVAIEVEVGDNDLYRNSVDPQPTSVSITLRTTNAEQGLAAESTPLAQALLGAIVGESVVLRVPGRPANGLTVLRITRPDQS